MKYSVRFSCMLNCYLIEFINVLCKYVLLISDEIISLLYNFHNLIKYFTIFNNICTFGYIKLVLILYNKCHIVTRIIIDQIRNTWNLIMNLVYVCLM